MNRSRKHHEPPCARGDRRVRDGSVALLALLLLALFSLLGVSAATTAILERQIAANDGWHKQYFYRAEAAAVEALGWISTLDAAQISGGMLPGIVAGIDMSVAANWESAGNAVASHADPERAYAIVIDGVTSPTPGSLWYHFRLYGRCAGPHGQALVEMGYRARYVEGTPSEQGVYYWKEVTP